MVSDGFRPPSRREGASVVGRYLGIASYFRQFTGNSRWNPLDVIRIVWRNCDDIRDAPSTQTSTGRQDAGPARSRSPAPAPRGRPRRGLPEPSVFRPARPRPGQVRDGAAPPRRREAGDRDRCALRGQPPGVLRGLGRVRGARDPRVGAQAPRAEGSPQVQRRGCRLRRALAGGGRRATGRAADGGRGATVWHLDSRPVARPGGCSPQKKTAPVDHGAAASGPDTEQVCRQYEVVRHDAATQAAFSRRGYGMALLMSRGMPAWLDAMSTISLPPVHSWSPAGNGDLELATPIRSELARVLASLVLRCVSEGASP